MANKFNIVITATDRASAVVRRFNTQLNNLTRPIGKTFESFRRLGREIGQNKIVKGLGAIAKGASNAASKIFSIGGAIAGVTLATSAVAAIDWMRSWAAGGVQLQNFAAITGQATNRILTLRGAAGYLGLTAQDLDGSLKNLGDTLEDATYGRNQQALALMNRLGISMKRTKDGAVDSAAALYDVSRAISRIKNVQAQGVVARAFGVEALLPLLQRGPAGIAALEARANRAGANITPKQLLEQQKTQDAFNNAGISGRNLMNAIGARLAPIVDAIAIGWGNWARVISGGPANFSQSPLAKGGNYFTSGRAWGDWKGSVITALTAKEIPKNAPARGLAAWLQGPRGIRTNNPGNLRSWGNAPVQGGYAAFPSAFAGISALAGQLLRYAGRGNDTLAGMAKTFAPAGDGNNVGAYIADLVKRTGFGAGQHLNLRDPKVLAAVTRGFIGHENGQQPYGAGLIDSAVKDRLAQGGGDASKTHVVVTFKNAPKGTTAEAKTASGKPVQTTLKIDYAMPDMTPP